MHQHLAMCNGVCAPYPPLPYYHHPRHHHHGVHVCSPYEILDPLPIPVVNNFTPPCYNDYSYRRNVPYIDYSCCDYGSRPPVIQTNVHNDVCYYLDEPYDEYDDDYGNSYRLSRSKVQLVDLAPKTKPRRNNNHMVVSTFQPTERNSPERIIIPRSTVVRNTTNPSYQRQRHMRLMPLHHSPESQYRIPDRRRSVVREMVPIATVPNSYPHRQSIRVRTLSPM
ncbi:unnamed protein product [Rotaria sordida]|uniref:Uncharacterized protein n=1 Tax=Rotaria sordida TaxID=392033 RepID=A0A818RX73_9BILA|nr:unnamed protein product [Rotaria sordida]CAF1172334.1 unnamed protein product [Rotaria sordida]CAF3532976.1 unnamed protein product [Rotaria sordida]CAF3657246.1 unnamed protein product [Rotaria sordida]